MKLNISLYLAAMTLFTGLIFSCSSEGGGKAGHATTISGTVKNAYGINAEFQELHLNQENTKTIDSVSFSKEGQFSLSLPEGIKPGFYGIRLGRGYFIIVSDGTEKSITIDGDITTLGKYEYTVNGSADSRIFAEVMQQLVSGKTTPDAIKDQIVGYENPYLSMLLSMQVFRNNPQYVDAYKAISNRANEKLKGSPDVSAFTNMVSMISNPPPANLPDRAQQQGPQLNVAEGQNAPDITLPDPNGRIRSLSSLKGKVVLLDFWASWCRPCRAANPHVVQLYNKYKDQGFTVFSVSLDRQNGKEKWVQAIKDDGLVWDSHVSDLKFWDSEAARLYGINSIPQTLLVDKKGKIAAIIPQGASPEPYIAKALGM